MRSRCEKKVKALQEEGNSSSDEDSDDDGSGGERGGRRRAPKVDVVQRTMVFTRSWKYIATIALKISAFFVIGIVFFSLTYNFGFVSIEKDLRENAVRVNYATYIRTSVRSVLWSTYDTSSGLTQGSVLAGIINTARYEINEINRGLEIGSSVFEIPPHGSLSSAQNTLIYDNACTVLSVVAADPSLRNECESVGTGIFRNGLSQAVLWYITRITELYVVAGPNFTVGLDSFRFLNRKDVVELERLERQFLQPALEQSVNEYTAQMRDTIDRRNATVLALLIAFIILSVVSYVAIYHRLIRSLDVEMKRTRAMMLMLPDDILGRMTWLDAYATKLAGGRRL
eukprot:Opistho-2@82987